MVVRVLGSLHACELQVSVGEVDKGNVAAQAFIKACKDINIPVTSDYNAGRNDGGSWVQANITADHVRASTSLACVARRRDGPTHTTTCTHISLACMARRRDCEGLGDCEGLRGGGRECTHSCTQPHNHTHSLPYTSLHGLHRYLPPSSGRGLFGLFPDRARASADGSLTVSCLTYATKVRCRCVM